MSERIHNFSRRKTNPGANCVTLWFHIRPLGHCATEQLYIAK